jgi:RNA polymerase sigma-70 factor (ECF subfamily)
MSRFRASETPEACFEALYAEHYARVLAYVLRRAPAAVAGDVVADVFLVAWRRLEDVPDEPLPWLLGVARKTLANERRGGRRRAALLGALEANRSEVVDAPVGRQAQAVGEAVDRLGETDRELLRLVAWDGLTTREASIVLGISHAACRVRLHRLRRRLRRELGAHGESRTTASRAVHLDAGKESR